MTPAAVHTILHWATEIMPRRDLSSTAKVVYMLLDRHQGDNDYAYPSLRRLAGECGRGGKGVSPVQRAIRELVSAGLVVVESTSGKGNKATNRYRVLRTTSGAQVRTTDGAHQWWCAPQTTTRAHHRRPSESAHRKRSESKRVRAEQIEAIYQAYPRHVGRVRALAAIEKAVRVIAERNGRSEPVAWLLERVQAFAGSPTGQAGQYCPHPATWFGQGRYDDDESEWRRDDCGKRPRSGRAQQHREDLKPRILGPPQL